MADDVSMDLEELRYLLSIAKRPQVLSFISGEIQHLEKLSKEADQVVPPQIPAPIPLSTAKLPSAPALSYTTLSLFSWDQDNDKVKIYISLEGVQQDKVETSFEPKSVEVKFQNVDGKNYKFAVPKLNKDIVPNLCKVTVKSNRVILTLPKASKGNWLDLQYKEDKLKKSSLDNDKDPMAGIMDLMKNMYEEGDEDIKRTIAKAWSDARSGKTANPKYS